MLGFFIWFLIIVSDRLFSSAKSNKKKTTLKVIRAKITLKEKCMGVEIFHSNSTVKGKTRHRVKFPGM